MNNMNRYKTRQIAFAEAELALREWAEPRAMAHISNARTIIRKANRGKSVADRLIPTGYEWASPGASRPTIVAFKANSIEFSYQTGPWSKPEVHKFEMPLTDLSLSVWDYNKRVREALKLAKIRKHNEKLKANTDARRELAKAIREQEAQLERLQAEGAKLEAKKPC